MPDTYQGAELWNQSLVDPDNRRPVDFAERRVLLDEIRASTDRSLLIDRLLGEWQTGAIKLFVTHVALQLRRSMPEVFLRGQYAALLAGEFALAFTRTLETQSILVWVPRLALRFTRGEHPWPLGELWGTQSILVPPGQYQDAFNTQRSFESNGSLQLCDCFRDFPLVVLVSKLE